MMTSKNRKEKIKMLMIVGIVIIVGIMIYKKMPYRCDYMKEIGMPMEKTYKKILEKFGKPDEIKRSKGYECVFYYEGKQIYFKQEKEDVPTNRVIVTSDTIEFGWRNVKVGMTRDTIEKIYRNNEKIIDTDENTIGIIDEPWWIHFEFDENDILKAIDFCWGP